MFYYYCYYYYYYYFHLNLLGIVIFRLSFYHCNFKIKFCTLQCSDYIRNTFTVTVTVTLLASSMNFKNMRNFHSNLLYTAKEFVNI